MTPDLPPQAAALRIAALEAEVAALRHKLDEQQALQASLHQSEQRFRALITSLQVGIVVQGARAEILLCNHVSLELLGLTEEEYLGRTSFDPRWRIVDEHSQPFAAEQRPVARVLSTRREVRDVVLGIFRPRRQDWVWLLVNAVPQLDAAGEVQQVVSTFTDITALRQAEARARELNEALLAVSTPCIPIADGVVIMPLIGRFDRLRSQHAIESILHYVAAHRVRTVLLDLTGLVVADEPISKTLAQIVQAIGLLGAPVLLSGISASLAQQLVASGQSLAHIPVFQSLQQAVDHALLQRREPAGKRPATRL